jgi:O-acetylhomoserine/O-acetylserine sulfhydrylase-like pyridoxal-dependent enzyme
VTETDAAFELAKTELAGAGARIQEAESAYQQAVDELATKTELQGRNASTVAEREIERLQNVVNGRQAAVAAAMASNQWCRRRYPRCCLRSRRSPRPLWRRRRSN